MKFGRIPYWKTRNKVIPSAPENEIQTAKSSSIGCNSAVYRDAYRAMRDKIKAKRPLINMNLSTSSRKCRSRWSNAGEDKEIIPEGGKQFIVCRLVFSCNFFIPLSRKGSEKVFKTSTD